jgi:hypothetical protein
VFQTIGVPTEPLGAAEDVDGGRRPEDANIPVATHEKSLKALTWLRDAVPTDLLQVLLDLRLDPGEHWSSDRSLMNALQTDFDCKSGHLGREGHHSGYLFAGDVPLNESGCL